VQRRGLPIWCCFTARVSSGYSTKCCAHNTSQRELSRLQSHCFQRAFGAKWRIRPVPKSAHHRWPSRWTAVRPLQPGRCPVPRASDSPIRQGWLQQQIRLGPLPERTCCESAGGSVLLLLGSGLAFRFVSRQGRAVLAAVQEHLVGERDPPVPRAMQLNRSSRETKRNWRNASARKRNEATQEFRGSLPSVPGCSTVVRCQCKQPFGRPYGYSSSCPEEDQSRCEQIIRCTTTTTKRWV
jgi:hypothetical protein